MTKWKGVWFYWCQKDFSSMPAPLTASLWVGRRKATVQWPPKSKGGQFARWVWPSWELFCCRQQCWSRPASYLPALPPASRPLLVFACSPIWRSSAHNPSDCRMAPSGLKLSSFSQSLLTKSRSVDFYSFHFIVSYVTKAITESFVASPQTFSYSSLFTFHVTKGSWVFWIFDVMSIYIFAIHTYSITRKNAVLCLFRLFLRPPLRQLHSMKPLWGDANIAHWTPFLSMNSNSCT